VTARSSAWFGANYRFVYIINLYRQAPASALSELRAERSAERFFLFVPAETIILTAIRYFGRIHRFNCFFAI